MNKLIKEQLEKTKISLPPFDDNTEVMFIKKSIYAGAISDIELGKMYIIYVEDYIVHEPDGFTLSINFNHSTCPDDNRLYAQIQKINGKMIFVATKGVNTGTLWSGWLPRKGFTIIEELRLGDK